MKNKKCLLFIFPVAVLLFNLAQGQEPATTSTQIFYDVSKSTQQIVSSLKDPAINSNGAMNLSLPIYNINCGNGITLPITLNYNGGGVKVSQRPTMLGTAFNLNAGGVVSRKINGLIDEYAFMIDNLEYPADILAPVGIYVNYASRDNISYMDNCTKLNRDDWNSTSFMDYIRSANGYVFVNNVNTTRPIDYTISIDLSPDEFSFNVGELSGTFYLNHLGQWVAKANKPINVKVNTKGGLLVSPNGYKIPRAISSIVITDDSGNKYYFGNATDDNPQSTYSAAIEFSRNRKSESYVAENRPSNNDEVPISWYLSKIVAANGVTTNIDYQNIAIINARNASSIFKYPGDNSGQVPIPPINEVLINNTEVSLINSPLIQKISNNQGLEINFQTSSVNDLNIFKDPLFSFFGRTRRTSALGSGYGGYKDMGSFNMNVANPSINKENRVKLEQINIYYNKELKKRIAFDYIDNDSERLKLSSLLFVDLSDIENSQEFTFGYNALKLPTYISGMEDYYGYYNGKFYFSSYTKGMDYTQGELFSNYLPSREPDLNFATAESLQKITTPQGGSIEYEYELNDYSSSIEYGTHQLKDELNIKRGCGLRIKRITQKDNVGLSPAITTDFKYTKDYAINHTSNISSGTLSSDITKQILFKNLSGTNTGEGVNLYHDISSYEKQDESPIVYSEITKIQNDGGFNISKFSTYSGNSLDRPVYMQNGYGDYSHAGEYDNRKDVRGKLIAEQYYNNNSKLLKQINYKYRYDANPVIENGDIIRTLQYNKYLGTNPVGLRYIAYPQYVYNNYLLSKETMDYHGNNSISMLEKYTYNQKFQLASMEKIGSNGKKYTTTFKYPSDLSIEVYPAMSVDNNISPVIEKTESIDDKQILFTRTNYSAGYENIIPNVRARPQSVEQKTVSHDIEKIQQFNLYDAYDNILEEQKANNLKTAYQWGYNGQYPVVKIQNASGNNRKTSYYNEYAYRQKTEYFTLNKLGENTFNFTINTPGDVRITLPGNLGEDWEATYNFGNNAYSGGLLSMRSLNRPNPEVSPWSEYLKRPDYYVISRTHSGVSAGTYTLRVYPDSRNASSSSVDQLNITYTEKYLSQIDTIIDGKNNFYYDGFEEGTGNATTSPYAGTGYYNGSFTLPRLNLSSDQQYEVNYHYLDGSTWKNKTIPFYEGMLLPGAAIDEIRVYPIGAQMTTYTYSPLIGKTSETDPNGNTIFYEYDGFGRQIQVKDKDRNVAKKYAYNYAPRSLNGQMFSNNPLSKNFTKSICENMPPEAIGSVPSTETYSIPAGKYTSLKSQFIADAKAKADIEKNGQTYANINGYCTWMYNFIPVPGINYNVLYAKSSIALDPRNGTVLCQNFSFKNVSLASLKNGLKIGSFPSDCRPKTPQSFTLLEHRQAGYGHGSRLVFQCEINALGDLYVKAIDGFPSKDIQELVESFGYPPSHGFVDFSFSTQN